MMNETKITKKQLLNKLHKISDEMDATESPAKADQDLMDMKNTVNHYSLDLASNLDDMMDSDGIAVREPLLHDLIDKKRDMEKDGETDDPEYPTVCDNLSYLMGGAGDFCFVGPEWHTESYGVFTGDFSHFDAVHNEDVKNMADELIKELNGDPSSEY